MIRKVFSLLILGLNITLFVIISILITKFIWDYLGQGYVFGKNPIGGDYFNALTYQIFFSKYLPHPGAGWLPFWNEGWSVIGGYPFLAFYLANFLTKYFNVIEAMNMFSIVTLVLFIVACLLLFRQISKNWLIAVGLTLIIIITRTTYYQLTTGGFIASASAQWYLPVTLFFIYKFAEKTHSKFLVLACIFSGLALLHHAGTSLLMVFLPSLLILAFLPLENKNLRSRLIYLLIFLIISFSIGISGLYTVYLQNFLGAGTDTCDSLQCWGIYPKHLEVWLTPLSALVPIIWLLLALFIKVIKRDLNLYFILAAILGFSVFFLYGLAAYLKLINGSANVIPPTRTFWAGNVLLMVIASSAFFTIQKIFRYLAWTFSLIFFVLISYYAYTNPPNIHKYQPNTIPENAAAYSLPGYQTKQLSDLVPDFVDLKNTNIRLDTFSSGFNQWWNIVSEMPQVRGYSNNALGVHRDWQYFLQESTRNPKGQNQDLIANRALFLADAFGVGIIENSIASYPDSIIQNPRITIKSKQLREFLWYQLSPDVVSPIVYPTNSDAVMFVGDKAGYINFIRTISLTNLNSYSVTPIKGPENINDLSKDDLKQIKFLILDRFKGNSWANISSFVQDGGSLYIERALNDQKPADIYPVDSFSELNLKGSLNPKISQQSALTDKVDVQAFANFEYQNGSWKFEEADSSSLRPNSFALLSKDQKIILAKRDLGKGHVFWSGMNLFFHIASSENFEEAKLFKNIILSGITPFKVANYTVLRPNPEKIIIDSDSIKGVYFKENYNQGWTAQINNQQLKVYNAGLDFMYIPVPSKGKIILTYSGNLISWIMFYLTCLSFLLSIIYLIIPNSQIFTKNLILRFFSPVIKKFQKRLHKLIEPEE